MITPQPQPAAYWIALLDELTDGWFSEIKIQTLKKKYYTLSDFLFSNTSFTQIGGYELMFWHKIEKNAEYIESGQSVIDAAVDDIGGNMSTYDYLLQQVQLYKRCNGIKD